MTDEFDDTTAEDVPETSEADAPEDALPPKDPDVLEVGSDEVPEDQP